MIVLLFTEKTFNIISFSTWNHFKIKNKYKCWLSVRINSAASAARPGPLRRRRQNGRQHSSAEETAAATGQTFRKSRFAFSRCVCCCDLYWVFYITLSNIICSKYYLILCTFYTYIWIICSFLMNNFKLKYSFCSID